jgi:GT2 family glycosyltransferase
MRKNSKIWWIGTKFFSIGDLLKNPKLSVSYHIDKEQEDNFFFEEPLEREAITGCALFLPRKLIEDVGLFDERFFMYGEDLDYSIRSKAKGYKLFIIPGTAVYHDVDLENEALITGRNFERIVRRYFMHFSSSLLLLHKHFSFFYFLIWFSRIPFSGTYEILKRLKFVKRTN